VLGAAREPLYLSQLQDLGLPAVSSGRGAGRGAAAGTSASGLRLGCLVNVRGYKLHGIHRCGAGASVCWCVGVSGMRPTPVG
jgi:hypothetical protein